MRKNLSKGMVVAAAATSILSLYAIPAFADPHSEGTTGGSHGALSSDALKAPDVPGASHDSARSDDDREHGGYGHDSGYSDDGDDAVHGDDADSEGIP
ncbi:hypothetical protein ACIRJQ_33775, partial [Streptomyces avermitilis]